MTLAVPVFSALVLILTHAPAHADRWSDALALVPPEAQTALVIPSPKQASDDLQMGLERTGRTELALGGRPIDFLRAQLGVGAGFDDKGILVAWTQAAAASSASATAADKAQEVPGWPRTNAEASWCALLPATDPEALLRSTFQVIDDGEDGALLADGKVVPVASGQWGPLFARGVGNHLLLGRDEGMVRAYKPQEGLAPVLASRLNARGQELARTGDLLWWIGPEGVQAYARQLHGAMAMGDPAAERRAGTLPLVEQAADVVITLDFDALGLGMRTFVQFRPGTPLAASAPASGSAASAPTPHNAMAGLLNFLPGGPFYFAAGVDLRPVGGITGLRQVLQALPNMSTITIPQWLDAVQDKVQGLQFACYPGRLPVLTGGLLNESALVITTSDPQGVMDAFRAWVLAQQGERPGVRVEATWERRELEGGDSAEAFAVKEVPTGAGPVDMMEAMSRQAIFGARGLHGFARVAPGALVVTFSQRPPVLKRAVEAAMEARSSGDAAAQAAPQGSLAGQGVVKSFTPWLMPEPDAVLFIGVGELLTAAQQVVAAMPGGNAAVLPVPVGAVEPIAAAFRARDGAWETAAMAPGSALAVLAEGAMRSTLRAVPADPPSTSTPPQP